MTSAPIRRFLHTALSAQGYSVFEAVNGQQALIMAAAERPEVIILDLGLPDLDGVEVTRQIREWTLTPILILSVREQESDKVAALDAGADDYLTKPFGIGELTARLRVALRRSVQAPAGAALEFGDLSIDLGRRLVTVGGREAALTPTEYELLRLLAQHPGKVLTQRQLLQKVWGEAYTAEAHLLRVNMSNLRRKIEPDPTRPRYLLTEPGIGYRLKLQDE